MQRGSMKSLVQNGTESGSDRMLLRVEVRTEAQAFLAFLGMCRTVGVRLLAAERIVESEGRDPFDGEEFPEGSLVEAAEASGRPDGRAMF